VARAGRTAWQAQAAYVVFVEPGEPRAAEVISGTAPARIGTIALGYLLLAAGAVLLFLPGPGIPLILAGLAVVGRQQHWARRLDGRLRLGAARVARRVSSRRRSPTGSAPALAPLGRRVRRDAAEMFTYSYDTFARTVRSTDAGLRCAKDAEERPSERGGGSDGCPSTLARRAPLDGVG
jgi:hypothetical protein